MDGVFQEKGFTQLLSKIDFYNMEQKDTCLTYIFLTLIVNICCAYISSVLTLK